MIYLNGKTEQAYKADYIHWECTAPEPKREVVEVPLRDGFIDLTGMLADEVFYKARTITIGLELRSLRGEWPTYWSQILRDLHGKEVEVSRSENPSWFWVGSATVGPLEDHGATAGVTITVTAQPYKRTRAFDGEMSLMLSGDRTVTIPVHYMRGYPEFECSTIGMTVTKDGETWTLPSGKSEAFGMFLKNGDNTLTVHGAGTMIIRWRGGTL